MLFFLIALIRFCNIINKEIFVQFNQKSYLNYENLDLNIICDNKKIQATVKPLFSNKIKSTENVILSENGKLIKGEEEVVNIFNDFFVNIFPNLGKRTQDEFLNTTDNSQDQIGNTISKYENPPSIISITKHIVRVNSSSIFKTVTKE